MWYTIGGRGRLPHSDDEPVDLDVAEVQCNKFVAVQIETWSASTRASASTRSSGQNRCWARS